MFMDFSEFPRVALCVLSILDRHCAQLPDTSAEFFSTYVSVAPKDLDGRLCAGVKRFNLNSIAPHSDTISLSPIMAALLNRQFSLVEQMQEKGASLSVPNTSHITPLLAACALADPQTIAWCGKHMPEREWKNSTGCYDPYESDVPLERLRATAPELLENLHASWSGQRLS